MYYSYGGDIVINNCLIEVQFWPLMNIIIRGHYMYMF